MASQIVGHSTLEDCTTNKKKIMAFQATSKWTKRNIMLLVAASLILIAIVCVAIWASTSTHTVESTDTDPQDTRGRTPVLVGIVPAADNAYRGAIPISTIFDEIDIFWDWKPAYDSTLYDMSSGDAIYAKYCPMNWALTASTDQQLLTYLKVATPKYVFSLNEPDMIGSIIPSASPPYDATGDGFWVTSELFAYGNATSGGVASVSEAVAGITSFPHVAERLFDDSVNMATASKSTIIATPVMARHPDITRGCAGYKPIDPHVSSGPGCNLDNAGNLVSVTNLFTGGHPVPDVTLATPCGYPHPDGTEVAPECKAKNTNADELNGLPYYVQNGTCNNGCDFKGDAGCFCNGWLTLARELSPPDMDWWSKAGVINMHSYGRYAHRIKLHVLEYLFVFAEDLIQRDDKGNVTKPGKGIMLTENAMIYSPSDLVGSTSVEVSAKFLMEVLWLDTKNDTESSSSTCMSYDKYTPPTILPGLRTSNTFTFNNRTASWYGHGFSGYTWFSANNFPGFPTECTSDYSPSINSNIWTDGKPNAIFRALNGMTPTS